MVSADGEDMALDLIFIYLRAVTTASLLNTVPLLVLAIQ